MSTPKPIIIVQGAQFGSESKGAVAAALCQRRNVDYAVRTGTVNAGHCVYKDGVKYVNQQLPTGWVNYDRGTNIIVGPGALVHPDVLKQEIEMMLGAGWQGMAYIDKRAGLHLPEHTTRSGMSGRHYRIGATGKGCSEAVIDRIRNRGTSQGLLFRDWLRETWEQPWMERIVLGDTVRMLHDAYDRGKQILLEGTQGTLLDLYLGPYPYTTHKQTTAAQWVVEAGLSPGMEYEIVLVARTYPIRVAGNSGPMDDEIDWPTLAFEINQKRINAEMPFIVSPTAVLEFKEAYAALEGTYADPNVEKSERNRDTLNRLSDQTVNELKKLFEFTTVTKKLRRVARLSIKDLKWSVKLNRPAWLCLTFLNYEFPQHWGEYNIPMDCVDYINDIERQIGAPVFAASFGPESKHLAFRNDTDR